MSKRIGPQMSNAVFIARNNPGIVPLQVARQLHVAAATGRNMALGYEPINRAISAGLLKCYPCPQNKSRSRLLTAEQDASLKALTAFARAL